MTTHFFHLTQENFHAARSAPPDANIVSFSQLRQAFFQQSFRGFSIKYVVAGQETYVVNGREHRVQAGEYLLTNPLCRGTGLVDSPETVTGICVDIRPAVLADVVGTLNCAGEPDGGADLAGFLQSADFYAQRFPGGGTRLGQALAGLGEPKRRLWIRTSFIPWPNCMSTPTATSAASWLPSRR
jgi:hypothetical protein